MVRWLARNKVRPISVVAGDTITAVYNGGGRHEEVTTNIDKAMTVDVIAVGEIEDELGFKHGVVGVFGKE